MRSGVGGGGALPASAKQLIAQGERRRAAGQGTRRCARTGLHAVVDGPRASDADTSRASPECQPGVPAMRRWCCLPLPEQGARAAEVAFHRAARRTMTLVAPAANQRGRSSPGRALMACSVPRAEYRPEHRHRPDCAGDGRLDPLEVGGGVTGSRRAAVTALSTVALVAAMA